MEIRKVKRPVFHLSKPGEDVRWTTRETPAPQLEAIRTRKRELALPTELPEKTAAPTIQERLRSLVPSFLNVEDAGEGAFSTYVRPDAFSISDPFHPDNLRQLSDDDLADMDANTDAETESWDEEMRRRGWRDL